jgi:uncharacterized membrane protein YeaQ/YmgE (transglycosylase-associated protein family)
MDIFYWALIGVLVALVAKVQIPTEGEENIFALLAVGIVGAVLSGMVLHALARTGFMSMSWVSHVAALIGAVALVLGLRVMTKQHLA